MKRRIAMVLTIFSIFVGGFGGYKLVERKIVSDIFSDVMERYQEAYRISYGLDVKCEDKEVKDENGYSYFILQEEKYASIEDIKNVLESVFTQGYINGGMHRVIGTQNALYKEIDGVLCRAHADSIALGVPTELCSIESKSYNKIVLMATNGEREWQITLLKVGDEWFIDDIVFVENTL